MQRLRIALIATAAVVIVGGGALIYGGVKHQGASGETLSPISQNGTTVPAAPTTRATVTPVKASSSPTPASTTESAKAKWTAGSAKLTAALTKLAAGSSFGVAVLDKKTGLTYSFHGTAHFDTASIVKAQILACVLLHDQTAGHGPTSYERTEATPMIRASDNNAATALFQHVGGAPAVQACDRKLGLTSTTVAGAWGLTKTDADDQIKLLSQLVNSSGPLSESSREYAFSLMTTVDVDEQWGIPSLKRSGEVASVKNGWDTRTADGGLWVINTIGRLTASDGHVNVSVAVLSHLNHSQDGGEDLVEKVAALTRQYLGY